MNPVLKPTIGASVRESREYRIAWRRFDRAAVEGIGQLFTEQARAHTGDENLVRRLQFQVSCDDGTTYESDAVDLFAEGSVAVLKNPIAVSFEYWVFSGAVEERLSVDLQHGDGVLSRIRVEGLDAKWVQSVFTRAKERVDACPPSDSWFTRHSSLTNVAAVFGTGSAVSFLVIVILSALAKLFSWSLPVLFPQTPLTNLGLPWVSRILWGGLVWGGVQSWFWAAWPRIELAFGPEHLRLPTTRRKALAYIATVVVIPLVLTLVADLRTALR